jgi:hypothetical protein
MVKVFFRNDKTGKEYEVVGMSEDKTEITLKGALRSYKSA